MQRDYVSAAVTLFTAIGITHAVRIFYQWDISVSGFDIPIWFSWFAVIVALVMISTGLKVLDKKR